MDKHIYYREGLKAENEQDRTIRGYAVVFNELTDKVGFYKERILKEAFNGLDLSNVVLIVGHDFKNLLAKNGINMRMEVDDDGLWFEAQLPNTQLGRDMFELIRQELLTGMSFGFITREENIITDYEHNTETITKIDEMLEITLTPIPAYPQTVATTVKKDDAQQDDEREQKLKKLEEI